MNKKDELKDITFVIKNKDNIDLINNKQDKLSEKNAGTNVTITEIDGVPKINSTGGSGGGISLEDVRTEITSQFDGITKLRSGKRLLFKQSNMADAVNLETFINDSIPIKRVGNIKYDFIVPLNLDIGDKKLINVGNGIEPNNGINLQQLSDGLSKKQDSGDYALKSDLPTFDNKSITKTSDGYFTQALTKQGTTEYLTFDQIKEKQDKLTAGNNIQINENEISAVGSDNFYGYILKESIDLNSATEYVFNDFDDKSWHLFNVEYLSPDNQKRSGSLERPANVALDVPDMNVANDFSNTSSATITFFGNTKKLQVLNWNKEPYKMTKVSIYKKLLFKADVDYITKEQLSLISKEYNGHQQLLQDATIFEGQGNKSRLNTWIESKIDKIYVDSQDQTILTQAKEYTDSKAPQFSDEESRLLKLLVQKILIRKDTENNDYFGGFTTPFDIVSELDNNITKLHIDYNTVQLYTSDGKSVLFIRDDLRLENSDGALTTQYTSDGKLLYGVNEQLNEVATKQELIDGLSTKQDAFDVELPLEMVDE